MKINLFLSIGFLLVFSMNLTSQTFPPISFESYHPEWIHYTNGNQENDSIRSYRTKDLIVDDENLYVLSNWIVDGFEGHSLEKLDMNTGGLDWSNFYYSDEVGKREYGGNIFKNENSIDLLTIKSNNNIGGYWDIGYIQSKKINSDFGLTVDSIFRNEGFVSRIPNGNVVKREIFLSPQDSNVLYFSFELNLKYIFSYVENLNSPTGELLSQELTQGLLDKGSYLDNDLFLLKDKSRYLIDHTAFKDDQDDFTLELLHLSAELDSLKSFELSGQMEGADYFEIVDASNDYFLIKSTQTLYTGVYLYPKYVYYLFDKEGVLIEKIVLENPEGDVKFDGGTAVKVEGEDKIYCVFSSESNGAQILNFVKSDGEGNLEYLNSIGSSSTEDRFQCKKILQIGEDFVLNLRHSSDVYPDVYAERSVWVRFAHDDIFTSTKSKTKLDHFGVFPNPSRGLVFIENKTGLSPEKIQIYDVQGKLRQEMKYTNFVDVSILSTGTYWLTILDQANHQLWNEKILIK